MPTLTICCICVTLLWFTQVNLPYFEIIYLHMPPLTSTAPCTCHLKPFWPSLYGDDLQWTSPEHYPTSTCNTSNYIVNFHSLNRLHLLWDIFFTLMHLALLCLSYIILGMPLLTLTTHVTTYPHLPPFTPSWHKLPSNVITYCHRPPLILTCHHITHLP